MSQGKRMRRVIGRLHLTSEISRSFAEYRARTMLGKETMQIISEIRGKNPARPRNIRAHALVYTGAAG
jgi:hypothetical protein